MFFKLSNVGGTLEILGKSKLIIRGSSRTREKAPFVNLGTCPRLGLYRPIGWRANRLKSDGMYVSDSQCRCHCFDTVTQVSGGAPRAEMGNALCNTQLVSYPELNGQSVHLFQRWCNTSK